MPKKTLCKAKWMNDCLIDSAKSLGNGANLRNGQSSSETTILEWNRRWWQTTLSKDGSRKCFQKILPKCKEAWPYWRGRPVWGSCKSSGTSWLCEMEQLWAIIWLVWPSSSYHLPTCWSHGAQSWKWQTWSQTKRWSKGQNSKTDRACSCTSTGKRWESWGETQPSRIDRNWHRPWSKSKWNGRNQTGTSTWTPTFERTCRWATLAMPLYSDTLKTTTQKFEKKNYTIWRNLLKIINCIHPFISSVWSRCSMVL